MQKPSIAVKTRSRSSTVRCTQKSDIFGQFLLFFSQYFLPRAESGSGASGFSTNFNKSLYYSIIASSLESANSSILAPRRLFKRGGGENIRILC